jgi:dipeptidyl aminopeptidase/acylaminoacyl peptidase
MRRLSALLVVFLLGLQPARGQPAEKLRPMTVDAVMKVRYLTDPALSPDGTQVVYVVSEADLKQGRYNTDLWLVPFDPLDGGAAVKLTNGPGRDDTPRWSRDGKKVAFISDRDGKPQVWLISPAGGEATKLTDSKTGVRDFAWSPDGKQIAYIAREPDTPEEKKQKQEKADVIVVGREKMEHLHLIPAAGGPSRQLTRGDFSVLNFSWSRNSKQIAYAAAPSRRLEDVYHSDIYVIATAGGPPRALVKRPGMDTLPKWSPDGKTIAFVSNEGKLDWLENTALCVVPAEGGTPRNVSKKFDGHIAAHGSGQYEWDKWARFGEGLYFLADQGASRHLFWVSVQKGEVIRLTSGARVHNAFSLGGGRRFVLMREDPATPPEVYVSAFAFRPRLLRRTTSNPQLAGVALGGVESIRWKSFDGLEVEGLLIKPVGYKDGTRYPLLTYIHGGPALQFAHGFSVYPPGPPQASRYPVHVLAGQGYAIFCPNPRGSEGYGKKFRQANVRDWGGGDYKDIMAGVDHLIARGIADRERLGVMGWSYGGYMTSWIITQTDRFKAASAGAGPTDLTSMYGQTDIPGFLERYFEGLPWKEGALYRKHSPLTHVGNAKTPTLIQHGEKDERVALAQSRQLYAALKRNGVPVEFVIYPRQGHNPSEPRLQVDVLRRNVDWFNRWLKKPGARSP